MMLSTAYHVALIAPASIKLSGVPTPFRAFDGMLSDTQSDDFMIFKTDAIYRDPLVSESVLQVSSMWPGVPCTASGSAPSARVAIAATLEIPRANIASMSAQPYLPRMK